MRCVRLRSDFHDFIKPEDASFHVVQGSQHLRVLLKLKIILLVRRLPIPIYTNVSPLVCEWKQNYEVEVSTAQEGRGSMRCKK